MLAQVLLAVLLLPSGAEEQKPAAPQGLRLGIYRLSGGSSADPARLRAVEDTFFDVARSSDRYREVVRLANPPKLCALEDEGCLAMVGGAQQLDQVLVGEVLRLQNGATVKVRLVDVGKGREVGHKDVTLQSDDDAELRAWAEALACDLLNDTTCKGQASIDVDLPDMRVLIDNLQYPRAGRTPEIFTLPLGVHSVRVTVDQRTSLERKLLVSRANPGRPQLYARQLSGGGVSLLRAQDLPDSGAGLSPSVRTGDLRLQKWTKPVGYTVAAVGLVAGLGGVVEGLHSHRLVRDANARYQANGGAYQQGDLATLESARQAASTANVLYVVSGVLLATGLTMSFAF